jgi:hypothetical protein
MKKLEYWFQNNNLIINFVKTVAMSFHTKQNRFPIRPKITLRNKVIANKSESEFLGICITENLCSWTFIKFKTEQSNLPY